MWLTMLIAAVLFVGMLAALYLGYQDSEKERARRPEVGVGGGPPPLSPWLKPANPWLVARTADEVVFEVEHRIDADLQEVAHLLTRPSPEIVSRLYRV